MDPSEEPEQELVEVEPVGVNPVEVDPVESGEGEWHEESPNAYLYFEESIEQLGVKATKDFNPGDVLLVYTGDVVPYERKAELRSTQKDNWIMLLPNGATTLEETIYIDATHCGNEARFLNHTCNPVEQNVRFKSLKPTVLRATRDIAAGEMLSANPVGEPGQNVRLEDGGMAPLPPLLIVEAIKCINKHDKLLISYVNTDSSGVKTVFLDFQEECKCSAPRHVIGTNATQ